MPRDGAIIFSDLIGKLDVLRVECPKCGRAGRYHLAALIRRLRPERKAVWHSDNGVLHIRWLTLRFPID